MVSTLDSESSDPSSNLGGTLMQSFSFLDFNLAQVNSHFWPDETGNTNVEQKPLWLHSLFSEIYQARLNNPDLC